MAKAMFTVFRGRKGWHWKLTAPNGEPIAVGAEPFFSAANARRAIKRVRTYAPKASEEAE